jgi:L-iditol 2-dehydrogenase
MGADAAFHASDDVPARLREHNKGKLAELVIVCTGALSAFQQALQSVDRGGTVLCFATTEPGVDLPVPINEFWRNEIKLMPSYGNSPLDALETIELLREKRVVAEPLVTHRLGLAETGLGFRLVAAADQSVKVIIEPFR